MNFDQKIEIQRQALTKNNFGEEAIAYTHFASAWAAVNYKGGREGFYASQVVATGEVVFKIRYIASLSETMRIVYKGRNYNISHIVEVGRNDILEITAIMHDND